MKSARKHMTLVVIASLIAVSAAVGCSSNSRPAAKPAETKRATLRTAALENVSAKSAPEPGTKLASVPEVKPKQKALTYKSRDYAVSFEYPWQYAYTNAKVIANGDEAFKPKSDGHDGQFTLARVDVPKGFYPDTDFQSGYFILSLNQNVAEEECDASLDAKDLQTRNINGVDFRWTENDTVGGGSAEKTRSYVAFTNGTCYEIELGVKTRNDGLAREIDPDQVLRRLDGILNTVTIVPATRKAQTVETSADVQN